VSGDDSRPFEEVWNRVIEEPGERRGLYLIDKTSFVVERNVLCSYPSYVFISFFFVASVPTCSYFSLPLQVF